MPLGGIDCVRGSCDDMPCLIEAKFDEGTPYVNRDVYERNSHLCICL